MRLIRKPVGADARQAYGTDYHCDKPAGEPRALAASISQHFEVPPHHGRERPVLERRRDIRIDGPTNLLDGHRPRGRAAARPDLFRETHEQRRPGGQNSGGLWPI
jgi:hypothetical protein